MANENKEFSEIVKKSTILLLDIEGTTTSISFVKDKLFPYAEENVKQFLDSQWESSDVKDAVTALRKAAVEDKEKNVEGLVAIPGEDATKEEQIEGLVNNVKWQMSLDRKAGPLKTLQGMIWKHGYDNGDIKGHVYSDVSPALDQWRSSDGQKVYIYSSGSVAAQKLLFGQSLAGNLLPRIDGHFDTAVGAKQEAASYAKIVDNIGCKPEEILFLTDILKEAEAARASGLNVALVSREGNAPLPADATFPVIHSLQQLTITNKRKPDAQEEIPAKIPKTDTEIDVKTSTEAEPVVKAATTPAPEENKEAEKPEQMEVEETPTVSEEVKEDKTKDTPVVKEDKTEENTVVEEATKPKEVPVVDVEPVITEEKSDKTDKNETEKMETEPIVTSEPKESTDLKNGDVTAAIKKVKPNIEIEEITDKEDLADVEEIIDDLEPVVEEPTSVEDMEDLQNVGEVLEKECDEILSKVQDVTNLDNIPMKPLLKTIAEETMETENVDTSDIVERILDTELELEMKQCDDIDLNTVQEITDDKTDAKEVKSTKVSTVASASTKFEIGLFDVDKGIKSKVITDGNTESKPKEKEVEPKAEESELVEASKPAEANKPAEASEPTTASEPAEASDPVEASKPAEDSKPAKASEPAEVTKPVETSTPAETSKPEENSKPAETAETIKPAETSKPAEEESDKKAEKESKEAPVESKEKPVESKEIEETKANDNEPQVNGKATNGDADTNGDSKDEELSARLSVEENGKELNGAGEAASVGAGATDVKVVPKSVPAEPRTDPIEQPTEA